jgi:hypothetical protein
MNPDGVSTVALIRDVSFHGLSANAASLFLNASEESRVPGLLLLHKSHQSGKMAAEIGNRVVPNGFR